MDILFNYFPTLTDHQRDQFRQLETEFRGWNERVNLIARTDVENLAERHFLHSLGIAKVIEFPAGSSVLDVGTGGGLPGLPLAILFPEVKFHLVDSIGKKIRAVEGMAEALHLTNVTAEQIRAEQLHTKYDYIVSRAVARLATFHTWIAHRYKPHAAANSGLYYLKGGDLTEEIAESGLKAHSTDLSDFFNEEFFETKKVVFVPSQKA
ncbi:16S rRNA (guanine(527)-N(7))-methyltransferase RsmG [Hymenobacter sp. NBH84]|uniref:Ribosomal RNA small subunit methyltransferase G n=1 Tax=Hymenobacter defluvii TaxID=2054411 RepID=A0ABS3TE25_9BACT|nr:MULTISPECIES: 16S rRNA (guanine(527)-N(7))-methyltransferase RsmG [Hymenobacter]MBO3271613.1 16S rRNA (guanine(527)-N(7))-methyltransferase RsmG [Hymenobacter defluvii]QNE38361.1 16S rRNA (guanine(527)-N(7))-methyltransferase RsmG [Hymenobacter sp. NBH84]